MKNNIMKLKKLLGLILCFGLIVSATACNTEDAQNNSALPQHQEVEHTIETDADAVNTAIAEPLPGGSISIFSYKPDTLCPILTTNNANMQMLNIVYDGLVDIDRDMSLTPALAVSWHCSDDAKVWYITLRDGVSWHNGNAFTIDDVKYTINQIKLNKDSYYAPIVECISYVRGSGSNLEITLKEPNAEFIKLLSFPIIQKQNVNVAKEDYIPCGTGAFVYEDRNEGNLYHLVRNERWWNGRSYLDEVTVKLLPDRDTALYSFSSGDLSMAPSENSDWGSFMDSTTDSFLSIPTNKFTFVGLNNKNKAIARQEVRQAINLIVNRDEIINDVLMSHGSTTTTPISRSAYMFDENYYTNRDAERARKLLEDSGWVYEDGCLEFRERTKVYKLKFEILVNEENAMREQIANAVSKHLNEFGFSTTVKKVSFEEYNKLIASKKYDMFIGTYRLREDNDFRFMLEKGNVFGFEDAEIDTAMQNIRLSVTEAEKLQAYSDFQRVFNDKCPIVGLCFENDIMLYKTTLEGQLSPIYNDIYRMLDKIYITE